MIMTENELVKSYLEAKDRYNQITVLSELNRITCDKVRDIIYRNTGEMPRLKNPESKGRKIKTDGANSDLKTLMEENDIPMNRLAAFIGRDKHSLSVKMQKELPELMKEMYETAIRNYIRYRDNGTLEEELRKPKEELYERFFYDLY